MKEIELALSQGKVAGLQWGDDDKPLIIALHGWLDNAASFHRLGPLLGEHYRFVAVDLPGHGHSDYLQPGAAYYIWESLDALYDICQCFAGQDIHLLGHSMGGVMAGLYSATFPQQIKSLILIDSMGPITTSAKQAPEQLAKGILEHRKPAPVLKVFRCLQDAIDARVKASQTLQGEEIAPVVERNLIAAEGGLCWRTDPRLRRASKVRFTEDQVEAFWSNIKIPVCGVVAERGIIPSQWLQARGALIDKLTVNRVAGHHHLHCQKEGAETSANLIHEFLKALEL